MATKRPAAKVQPPNNRVLEQLPAVVRIAVFVLSLIYLSPIKVYPIVSGLDPSWAYAVNDAHAKGLVWGRDVGFTYGPWAYLSIGMQVGSNLSSAIAVQIAAWILGAPVLWYLLIRRAPSIVAATLFAASLGFSYTALHKFGYVGLDHYCSLMVILLLAAATQARRWQIPYGAAIAVAAFAAMIKFSAGVFSLSALVLFALVALLHERSRAVRALAMAATLPPAIFTLLYLSHHASLETMGGFLRTSMERSDAYNISNSLPASAGDLLAALALFSCFLAFSAVLLLCRDKAAYFAMAMLGPWFFVFKHGFVRADSHVGIFFAMGGAIFGCLLLITEFERKQWWKYALPLLVLALAEPPLLQWHSGFAEAWQNLRSNTQVPPASLEADKLPEKLLSAAAGKSIVAFPWELAYGAANALDFRPMPMLQTYGADSAWLDNWNARMFKQAESRPQLLLMEWQAIDGRHVLLDAPSTALEIFRWYDVGQRVGERLLAAKRDSPRFSSTRPLRQFSARIGERIDVPVSRQAVTGSLRMHLSLYGKLVKLLWKIPEVKLTLLSGDGRSWQHRVIPDDLSNQGLISALPFNLAQWQRLLGQQQVDHTVKHLLISGPGAPYYQPEIEAEFFEIPEVAISEAPLETVTYAALANAQSIDAWRIESVNGEDASMGGYFTLPATSRFAQLTGWAVDPVSGDCAAAVAVEVDGKRESQAVYGIPRPEIPLLLKDQQCMTSGFAWSLPLARGQHTLRLMILASKRNAWYPADKRITLVAP